MIHNAKAIRRQAIIIKACIDSLINALDKSNFEEARRYMDLADQEIKALAKIERG
jgi:hypothetical protein